MTEYGNLSDEDLVDLLKASDGAAFTEIFKRYRSLLLLFTYRRLSDVEQAKDLIHDAFTDLWEKRKTINISGELRPFLITIVKNRILNLYKHKLVSQKHLDDLRNSLLTEENTTDYLVRQKELSALIEKEIEALPEKMQIVFNLSRKEYMNRKEISDTLGIPQETVNSRMRHAMKILRGKLSTIIFFPFL